MQACPTGCFKTLRVVERHAPCLAALFRGAVSVFQNGGKAASGPQFASWARSRSRSGAFCSVFRSKFKAQKTPPSHGLMGFAAIKKVAKTKACRACPAAQAGLQPGAEQAPNRRYGRRANTARTRARSSGVSTPAPGALAATCTAMRWPCQSARNCSSDSVCSMGAGGICGKPRRNAAR